ncbi:copper chaperone CopZ [Alteribacter aurantiacus]|uniref:copper chaperone CopZ n=1 Tax=Alteribacter aurantiacus TaxID=254410 RepID=UPI00040BF908|nr:copper chaperone CopZ [Alteribacter aurantiacus]
MEQNSLLVKGMSCAHCVKSIQESVGALEGVQSVNVYLQDEKVDVEYNAQKVSLVKVKEVIEEQGYDVTGELESSSSSCGCN